MPAPQRGAPHWIPHRPGGTGREQKMHNTASTSPLLLINSSALGF